VNKTTFRRGIELIKKDPKVIVDLINVREINLEYISYKSKLNFAKKFFKSNFSERENYDFLKKIEEMSKNIMLVDYYNQNTYHIILYCIVRMVKPKKILETGVSNGASSLFILQALKDNNYGNLFSIDLPLSKYDAGKKGIVKDGVPPDRVGRCVPKNLRNRWNLILGNSKNEIPKILQENPIIDIFLHDSEHSFEHMMWEFNTVWPYLKKDGILISDDTDWNDVFEIFSKEKNEPKLIVRRNKKTQGYFGLIKKNVNVKIDHNY